MKRIYIFLLIAVLFTQLKTIAQGCVAITGIPGFCSRLSDTKEGELYLNSRYFKFL